jgi:hypothetical protein
MIGSDASNGGAAIVGDQAPLIVSGPRPSLRASAPQRYRVQFTIGQETHDRVRRLQALMRREVPSGDLAVIFDRAVNLMLQTVERAKLGARTSDRRPQRTAPRRRGSSTKPREGATSPPEARVGATHEDRIRFRTDAPSRHIPNAVKTAVWRRDAGRCAFVSADGYRCHERSFIQFHHIQPYALDGPTSVKNLSLRCRRHNVYEAELVFGPRNVPPEAGAGASRADP